MLFGGSDTAGGAGRRKGLSSTGGPRIRLRPRQPPRAASAASLALPACVYKAAITQTLHVRRLDVRGMLGLAGWAVPGRVTDRPKPPRAPTGGKRGGAFSKFTALFSTPRARGAPWWRSSCA